MYMYKYNYNTVNPNDLTTFMFNVFAMVGVLTSNNFNNFYNTEVTTIIDTHIYNY